MAKKPLKNLDAYVQTINWILDQLDTHDAVSAVIDDAMSRDEPVKGIDEPEIYEFPLFVEQVRGFEDEDELVEFLKHQKENLEMAKTLFELPPREEDDEQPANV